MKNLYQERVSLDEHLQRAVTMITEFWRSDESRHASISQCPDLPARPLVEQGLGLTQAMQRYQQEIEPYLANSAGGRYLGFITGGVTPASLVGDILAAGVDQNVSHGEGSIAPRVEEAAIKLLLDLFHLPREDFFGAFTSGATASNLLGIICGRQYAGLKNGVDIAESGFSPNMLRVFSTSPHASVVKCLGVAGIGRQQWQRVPAIEGERMDVDALEQALAACDVKGKMVIASAGTITTNQFDDLEAIAEVCQRHDAWLHVDAAFGIFARVSPDYAHLAAGLESADSIAGDGHKWLNVPYDCGFFFTRHQSLLNASFSALAPYLTASGVVPNYMEYGVENSRRFRALPVWMALTAYGRSAHRAIVEQCCLLARQLAAWLELSESYQLMTPCRLNGVVFRCIVGEADQLDSLNARLLQRINNSGEVFMSPAGWQGHVGIRLAFSHWYTQGKDVEAITSLLERLVE